MTYESWRISYQSSESAARAAWKEMIRVHHRANELEAQLSAIGAGGVEPLRKQASTADVNDERDAFEKWLRIKPCGAAHDFGWEAWKARASLAATPAAGELATLQAGLQAGLQAAAPAVLPEPAAWLATFRPKGMLSSHSIAGANFEELKCSVPSDSVFKPLYTRHAEGATAQTGTYAEARECEHCNHVGINDSAEGVATCVACKWIGDSPKEDKCPDCEAEGTMAASCPKCHHEYRLIADATLAATQPAAQGMDAQDAARYRYLRETDRYFSDDKDGAIYVRQVGITSGVITGSTILTDEELDAAIDAALATQAKKGV